METIVLNLPVSSFQFPISIFEFPFSIFALRISIFQFPILKPVYFSRLRYYK